MHMQNVGFLMMRLTLKNVNPGFQGPYEGFFENIHQSSTAMDLWCHGMAGILNLFIYGKSWVEEYLFLLKPCKKTKPA